MTTKLSRLPAEYLAALRSQRKPGAKVSLSSAARLGRRAVALGLETLDLARIHAQALTTLLRPERSTRFRAGTIARAKAFFAEAVIPIEKTHRAALQADRHLRQVNRTLRQRMAESSVSVRDLKRGIARRQASERVLKKSAKHRHHLLAESRRLEKHARLLTHEFLAAQEGEWQKSSRQLHDQIAQILLGIQVRLLTLKKAARANTGSLKKDIASTQKLVQQSGRTIKQFAHEFGLPHEA